MGPTGHLFFGEGHGLGEIGEKLSDLAMRRSKFLYGRHWLRKFISKVGKMTVITCNRKTRMIIVPLNSLPSVIDITGDHIDWPTRSKNTNYSELLGSSKCSLMVRYSRCAKSSERKGLGPIYKRLTWNLIDR